MYRYIHSKLHNIYKLCLWLSLNIETTFGIHVVLLHSNVHATRVYGCWLYSLTKPKPTSTMAVGFTLFPTVKRPTERSRPPHGGQSTFSVTRPNAGGQNVGRRCVLIGDLATPVGVSFNGVCLGQKGGSGRVTGSRRGHRRVKAVTGSRGLSGRECVLFSQPL